MTSCLFGVTIFLTAVSYVSCSWIHDGSVAGNCYMAIAGWDVNAMFAPYGGSGLLREIDNNGVWGDREIIFQHGFFLADKGIPDYGRSISTALEWQDTCLRPSSNAFRVRSSSGWIENEQPYSFLYKVISPIKAPYLGRYSADPAKPNDQISTLKTGFDTCYAFAKAQKHFVTGEPAHGIEWNYETKICHVVWNGTVGGDVEYKCANTANLCPKDHWHAQVFDPVPVPGTTVERIPVGPADTATLCAQKVKTADPTGAKFVTFDHKEGKCYYSTTNEVEQTCTSCDHWTVQEIGKPVPTEDFAFLFSKRCK